MKSTSPGRNLLSVRVAPKGPNAGLGFLTSSAPAHCGARTIRLTHRADVFHIIACPRKGERGNVESRYPLLCPALRAMASAKSLRLPVVGHAAGPFCDVKLAMD